MNQSYGKLAEGYRIYLRLNDLLEMMFADMYCGIHFLFCTD